MEKEKFFTEYLELPYLILFVISVGIAVFFLGDVKNYVLVLAVLILIYLILTILSLLIFSRFEKIKKAKNNYNQDRFTNFWKNNLSPNEKEEELKLIPKIVIIDHTSNSEKIFKDIHDNQKLLPEDNQLFINNLDTVFSKEYVLVRRWECKDDEKHEKTNLKQLLEGAKGVIFSRTKGLEKDWFYEILNDWAKEHSEFPCLYVDKLSVKDKKELEKKGKLSKIPAYFNKIEDEIGHLPWKFLIKSNQRSANWKKQAIYNRFIGLLFFTLFATSLIFLLIIGIVLYVQNKSNQPSGDNALLLNQQNEIKKLVQNQRKESYDSLNNIYKNQGEETHKEDIKKLWKKIVKTVRSEYLISFTDVSDINELQISFWYRNNKDIQAFITSESGKPKDRWDFDLTSLSGCSFKIPNSHAQWDRNTTIGNTTIVWDLGLNPLGNGGCLADPRDSNPPTSIICTSYNDEKGNPENLTVGICAFALNKSTDPSHKPNIFLKDYRSFLQDQAQKFYEFAKPLIKENKITPLITNEKNEVESLKAYE